MPRAIVLTAFLLSFTIGASFAEPIEFVFVLRDHSRGFQVADDELVRMQDRTEAECRFETNKAAASAGALVLPGQPGIGFAGTSPTRAALCNLAAAITETGPTILPGMTSTQMWEFFVSCFEAKGYRVMSMVDFQIEKARILSAHSAYRLRGVAKSYDFQ